MKKVIALILAMLMVFTLAACGQEQPSGTPADPGKEPAADAPDASGDVEPEVIKLSLVHHWNADSYQQTEQFEGYFNKLEEVLDGKYDFQIDYYPTGTLMSEADIYDGVVDGVVDIGGSTSTMHSERFLCINAINYPGAVTRDNASANSLINQEYFEIYQFAELEDVKVLYCWGNTINMIHSTEPILTLEDLQGKTIRVTGVSAELFTLLGATPIAMSWGEVASSAQKGLIDGAFGTPNMLTDYNLHEVFPYSTYTEELGAGNLFVIMNKDKFESLPEDVQKAMDDMAYFGAALAGAVWDYDSRHAVETTEALGHEFLHRDDAEISRWTELASVMSDNYALKLTDAGYPGEDMIKTLRELSIKYDVVEDEGWEPGEVFEPSVLKIED